MEALGKGHALKLRLCNERWNWENQKSSRNKLFLLSQRNKRRCQLPKNFARLWVIPVPNCVKKRDYKLCPQTVIRQKPFNWLYTRPLHQRAVVQSKHSEPCHDPSSDLLWWSSNTVRTEWAALGVTCWKVIRSQCSGYFFVVVRSNVTH